MTPNEILERMRILSVLQWMIVEHNQETLSKEHGILEAVVQFEQQGERMCTG
jgi:hypothetical protein